jgi:hypothetical protein
LTVPCAAHIKIFITGRSSRRPAALTMLVPLFFKLIKHTLIPFLDSDPFRHVVIHRYGLFVAPFNFSRKRDVTRQAKDIGKGKYKARFLETQATSSRLGLSPIAARP